jgi:FixJ family two-component response regulator
MPLPPEMIWFIDVMAAVAERPATIILIVESDRDLRMVAVEFVKQEGFETLEASDADQAIAILESRPEIAVLFTNIDMPGSTNGLKFESYQAKTLRRGHLSPLAGRGRRPSEARAPGEGAPLRGRS